jgi:nucleotide-binding universal stress UspA family protein
MPTLRSILCPVDFSDQSQQALRWAVALAARHQSRLVVLTAVDPLLAQAARARFSLDLAEAETAPALREFVKAVSPAHASWAAKSSIDVRVGSAHEEILDAADRERADLIVMGTQGLGGFRKLLLGSTTERVLRRTHTPLLAVPLVDGQPVVLLEDREPRFNMETILMATDFSEASAEAVRWAADVAREIAVPLLLTHVVTPADAPPQWRSYLGDADDERAALARIRLEGLSAQLSGSPASDTMVAVGWPADAIASIAQERRSGLIVLGLSGHHGTLAPRPGSIAYRVLCLARVPVLVVPKPGAGRDQDGPAAKAT